MNRGSTHRLRNVRALLLQALEDQNVIIIYDIETTGLNPTDMKNKKAASIIQIFARKCFTCDEGVQEVEIASWYINPGFSLDKETVKFTSITDEILKDQPCEKNVAKDIIDFFGNYAVAGYNNIKFDDEFMKYLFRRYSNAFSPRETIDLYQVSKKAIQPDQVENYKLPTIARYFSIDKDIEQFHNAEADTLATMLCFDKLVGIFKAHPILINANLIKCVVTQVSYWQNPRNWKKSKIYVDTDRADFILEPFNIYWQLKERNDRIERYDLDDIIEQVLLLTGCESEFDLVKFKGRVHV